MNKKIVVIGGGHGQAAICRGLKSLAGTELAAITTVADDGGSTGRLRKQFDIPAMGDIRNVMISLAEKETAMVSLMNYRFEDKTGSENDVAGHNVGNLILTALTYQRGSFLKAIELLSKALKIKGRVIPSTTDFITLVALMENGEKVRGEANIPSFETKIARVFYEQEVKANPEAVKAILEADLIIYGIGSLYTSILANVIIKDIAAALKQTKAKRVYFANAMTQADETRDYSLEDHIRALERHSVIVDAVLYSKDFIPKSILERYAKVGSAPVLIKEKNHNYEIIAENILSFEKNLIRHTPKKIKRVIKKLLET